MPRSGRTAVCRRVERSAAVGPTLGAPSLPESESDPPVQVVVAYADHAAFQTALGVYRAIVQRLAGRFKFRDSWWRFGAFANPDQLEHAARLAAVADIIFCCLDDPGELPLAVRDWIVLWTAHRKQQEGALAALLPATATPSAASPSPVRKYLEEVAKANGLAFFTTEYALHPVRNSVARLGESVPPYGEDFLVCHVETKPEVRHWGLNE